MDKKGPDMLMAAFAEVVKEYPAARLTMVGDGILLNTCKNLARLWRLEDAVHFAGIKSPGDIFTLFEKSLAFVQHSVTAENGDNEGTPVAILDAQAAALPVISTLHAGIPDIVNNNETGLLSAEYDVRGMAVNMLKVIHEKKLAEYLGAAGRQRIKENFTVDKHLKTIQEAIERSMLTTRP